MGTWADGTVLWDTDILNIMEAIKGNGVISGLAVSQRGAGINLSVDTALGVACVNITGVKKTATVNTAITAADGSNPRYDIITLNSAGTITATAGTAAANPVPANLPANEILLAYVYVGTGVTEITDANITDKRVNIRSGTARKLIYSTNVQASTTATSATTIQTTGAFDAKYSKIFVKAYGHVSLTEQNNLVDTVTGYLGIFKDSTQIGSYVVATYNTEASGANTDTHGSGLAIEFVLADGTDYTYGDSITITAQGYRSGGLGGTIYVDSYIVEGVE